MTDNFELEKTIWAAPDKLGNNMDAGGYKQVAPGLIFLKYFSDAFDEPCPDGFRNCGGL